MVSRIPNIMIFWKSESYVESIGETKTKYVKLKTKTQNNIVIFGFFHKKIMLLFWLFLKQFD